MIEVANWRSGFQMWAFSVSYRRLLWRSSDVGDDGRRRRIDVLFSNVEHLHVDATYDGFHLHELTDSEALSKGLESGFGKWFQVNSGQGLILATHCQWHEDEEGPMAPSKFGVFEEIL